ncbi:MAG: Flp pilus assembly protein CpaB [Deltaproteobacteria bacterium RBG_13_58_19]|nr:MAG: Flp pilus assembly protein CpaB [Deltaproteobacteria bacterium RBG_13_58_19]
MQVMRRLPPWLWLVLALVFGTTATFMAISWLKGQSQKQAQEVKTAPVVIAAKEIGPAMALAGDQLVVRRWPQENCPQGGFATVEEVMGRVSAYPFGAGEPILEVKLAPKGMAPGLTALLPPEKRAMTVKVDEASGVAGFLTPDNRVDVVVSVDKGSFSENPVAKMVLQNLRVLGTGQKIEKRPGDKPQVVPTVTLEVTPEEGERLALAAQEGHLSLILRGQQDQQVVQTNGVRTNDLLGGSAGVATSTEPEKINEPPAPGRTVMVIRRVKQEPMTF